MGSIIGLIANSTSWRFIILSNIRMKQCWCSHKKKNNSDIFIFSCLTISRSQLGWNLSQLHTQTDPAHDWSDAEQRQPFKLTHTAKLESPVNPNHVFGLWEEVWAPGENPGIKWRACRLHTGDSNPWPCWCDVMVPSNAPVFPKFPQLEHTQDA